MIAFCGEGGAAGQGDGPLFAHLAKAAERSNIFTFGG
jgi:hypothetical protein